MAYLILFGYGLDVGNFNLCLGNGAVQQQLIVIAIRSPRLPRPIHVV